MAMVAGAYQQAQLTGISTTSSSMTAITQYMNYVAVDTSSTIDQRPSAAASTVTCTGTLKCLRLHNGALFLVDTTTGTYMAGTLDPDGVLTGNKDSLLIAVYDNGRVTYLTTAPSWLNL
jgi:hypothetical protein